MGWFDYLRFLMGWPANGEAVAPQVVDLNITCRITQSLPLTATVQTTQAITARIQNSLSIDAIVGDPR